MHDVGAGGERVGVVLDGHFVHASEGEGHANDEHDDPVAGSQRVRGLAGVVETGDRTLFAEGHQREPEYAQRTLGFFIPHGQVAYSFIQ